MNQLDHIVIAAPDLAQAKQQIADQTGVRPIDGGPHLGLGSRNALVSFGNGSYLEIIAPDPDQSLDGNFGAVLAGLSEPELLHWAIRTDDLNSVATAARQAGFVPGDIRATSRKTPAGELLEWQLMGIGGHQHGGFVPFYIDWMQCVHPSETSPLAGHLAEFSLTVPEPVMALLTPAPDGIKLVRATGEPNLTVGVASDNGLVNFSSHTLAGFRL